MYFIMSLERDEWGKLTYFRRGPMYKKYDTAIKNCKKLSEANVFKYGKKVPVYTTNKSLKDIINDQGIYNNT